MTQVVDGDLLKVMSWYDTEWGYWSQLVREAVRIARRWIVSAPSAFRLEWESNHDTTDRLREDSP